MPKFTPIIDDGTKTSRQIPSLDGLRGIAVLFVLLSHLSNAKLDLLPFLSFSGIGKVGVWLFFVLSAFLLTGQFLDRDDAAVARPALWGSYFVRRFFRIYPLFAFVMVVSFLLKDLTIFPPFAAPSSSADLFRRLTLQDAQGVEWSILVEFRFYFLLPLIVGVVVLLRRWSHVVVMLFLGSAVVVSSALAPPPSYVELSPYLSVFFLGVTAAYVYWWTAGLRSRAGAGLQSAAESIAMLVFAIIMMLTPSIYGILTHRNIPLDYFHSNVTLFGVLWAIFLLAYLSGTGMISRMLTWRPLRYLGAISFGLYLWHPPVIKIVADHIRVHPSIQALLAIALAIAVATLTYVVVERPFLRIRLITPRRLDNADEPRYA